MVAVHSTYHYSCTWFHHFHRCNTDSRPVPKHRSYCDDWSSMVRPSIGQHVDPIFPPMPDNCWNRSRPMHKYNCRPRPSGNSVDACSSSDMNSRRRSVYRIVRSCSSSWHHRSRHQCILNHRTSKFPSTIASIRAALCIAMCLSLDYSIRPLINQLHRHIYTNGECERRWKAGEKWMWMWIWMYTSCACVCGCDK